MDARSISTLFTRNFFALCAIVSSTALLNACGSDAHGAYNGSSNNTPPAAVADLDGNAGDGAVSLGWAAPDPKTLPLTYNIAISPNAPNATITTSDTQALIRGLINDTTYTFSITAKNNSGESTATTILLKPSAIDTSSIGPIKDDGNLIGIAPGIADASLLNESNTLWMVYSRIDSYQSSINSVQNVSTGLAYSDDSGATFSPAPTNIINNSVTDTITARTTSPCGANTCSGRWVYEMPFMIDDNSDDPSKRFKLFSLKYFIVPQATASASYAFGAIVMKTAAAPGSAWSDEKVVLSWNSTPQNLSAINNINTIDASLSECTSLIEGGATIYQDAIDFVFACPNSLGTQKIVLLRSTDHANTFKYIATPLSVADATSLGALYFSAPSLLPSASNAPVLIATPVTNRLLNGFSSLQPIYSGCKVFPFSDEEAGVLFRANNVPISILSIPFAQNHASGACAWDRGVGASGILINDQDPSAIVPFTLLNTAHRL